jgi:hypothetical protein
MDQVTGVEPSYNMSAAERGEAMSPKVLLKA